MPNLMIHCGANHVDRTEVEKASTPQPVKTWFPIPHQRLLNLVESSLRSSNLKVLNEAHSLAPNRYFGLLEVGYRDQPNGYRMVVGVRNSHDRTFPAGIAVGHCVLCCDNLAFSGEVTLARRHTRFIERDLPGIVHRAIGELGTMRTQQDQRIKSYKATILSEEKAHDAMIRAVDARVLPVSKLATVIAEWRDPSHDEFAEGGFTGWRLFNAITEAVKGRNIHSLPKRTQALHGLMDRLCNLAV